MKRFPCILITGLVIILISGLFSLQTFAQQELSDEIQFLFPLPGSNHVHPESTIILRFRSNSPTDLTNHLTCITVRGEESGMHAGTTSVASDGHTIIFEPEKDFRAGETVLVCIDPEFSGSRLDKLDVLNYEFTILDEAVSSYPLSKEEIQNQVSSGNLKRTGNNQPMIMQNGVSVPADFPHVNISNDFNPSDEHVFLNTWDTPNYNVVFNTSGEPLWYWKTADRRDDFKVQANDWITMFVEDAYGGEGPAFMALNQDFDFIKSMRASNGYSTDEHDFHMLPDNGYILIGQRETLVDMSQYVIGGRTDAIVRETCIQEFTANDELIFIWRAWDHFDIRDLELESLTSGSIRFPHMNAVFTDEDGHILLSSRHLSEISKIHRRSGEFIWRLSGIPDSPNSDFQFERDPLNGFRNQHAIRSLGNNTYTIFDNGNLHDPPTSRAVEYELDTVHMTATLVEEHRSKFDRSFVSHMGNSQQLPNGNTHINWAYGNMLPVATELTPAGETVFEMWFDQGNRCYRTFRHPWNGICQVPYLLLEPQSDALILIFNKFGDENVDYYNIYGGTSPQPGTLIDSSRTTLKYLSDLPVGTRYFFRVTAVDKSGMESGFSNEEDVLLRNMEPGTNLIINGDFSRGLDEWLWQADSTAMAEVLVLDSVCHFEIDDGGSNYRDIQLSQNNIPLIRGEKYLLEFDAWADETRIVEVELGALNPPYTDYSRMGYTALDPASQKYSYSFVMNESTDLNARVLIQAGSSSEDIYVDNISLKIDAPSNTPDQDQRDGKFMLYPNHPNPFSSSTIIGYELPEASKVILSIYNYMGQKLAEYVHAEQMPGTYSKELQLADYPSGVYYYTLEAYVLNFGLGYRQTKKMLLLK